MKTTDKLTEAELEEIKTEVLFCLRAYHNVPSEQVGDALMCHLYEKFAVRFGLDPLDRS